MLIKDNLSMTLHVYRDICKLFYSVCMPSHYSGHVILGTYTIANAQGVMKDVGFKGFISKMYVWDKSLSQGEVVSLAGTANSAIPPTVLSPWGHFLLDIGSRFTAPSKAGVGQSIDVRGKATAVI